MPQITGTITLDLIRVLIAFATSNEELTLTSIVKERGMPQTTVSQILTRLHKAKWIAKRKPSGIQPGYTKAPYQFYRLTALGLRKAKETLGPHGKDVAAANRGLDRKLRAIQRTPK